MNLLGERATVFGAYIVQNNSTIRQTAKYFNISKSTVWNDINKHLKYENHALYERVKLVLAINYRDKHLRGGNSTKLKYLKNKKSC